MRSICTHQGKTRALTSLRRLAVAIINGGLYMRGVMSMQQSIKLRKMAYHIVFIVRWVCARVGMIPPGVEAAICGWTRRAGIAHVIGHDKGKRRIGWVDTGHPAGKAR